MDGTEGRLSFGGQAEAPKGQKKNLGQTGGWDVDHIEAVDFDVKEARSTDQEDQGRTYAGLMSMDAYIAKTNETAEAFALKAEIDADPAAYQRKKAREAQNKDLDFKQMEEVARQERLAQKRAQFAKESSRDEGEGEGEEENEGLALKKSIGKKKKKKKKEKKSLLSFGGDDE